MKTKSLLSYFGSDSEVAADIGSRFNHCDHVTIAFAGGLGVLPFVTARGIVANDLNDRAINFYRCLKNPETRPFLINRCARTLSHPSELAVARDVLQTSKECVELAWAYWVMCWVGRKGQGGTKTLTKAKTPSIRRKANGGNNASRLQTVIADLDVWAVHIARCEFESDCFRIQLPKVADDATCGIYADAPWVVAGKNYEHPFVEQDHRDLAAQLSRFVNSTVVIRYGDDPLLRSLYPEPDWTWIANTSRTQANKVRNEVLICRNTEQPC